jgi:hypothetical protein
MKWSDVQAGQTIRVKGVEWKVLARGAGGITMTNPSMGEKTGNPPPDGEVELVTAPPTIHAPSERHEDAKRDTGTAQEKLVWYGERMKGDKPATDAELALTRLRNYAKKLGMHSTEVREASEAKLREYITAKHDEQLAKDNEEPVRKVTDLRLRLMLGATLVADLHEGVERPACPKVEVMDPQTMRNHLHLFHEVSVPLALDLEKLAKLHEEHHAEDRETVLHDHSVPF